MKRLRQSLRVVLHEPTFFHGYRWLAWGLAALALLLADSINVDPAFHVWLWVLVGVLNVLATALAQSYVRIARLRPAVLSLDIVGGVALVWLSGGEVLPFLPYALGTLVLPTLLFGVRGGLLAGTAFAAFDQVALWAMNQQVAARRLPLVPDVLMRTAVPYLFVLGLAWLFYLLRQAAGQSAPLVPDIAGRPLIPSGDRSAGGIGQRRSSRFTSQLPALPRPYEPAVADTPVVAPLAAPHMSARR